MQEHITREDIRCAVQELGLSNQPVCIHSSLRSFGWVEGGPETVIQGFLDEGCTVMVPSFSGMFSAPLPPADWRPEHNGWNYARYKKATWPEVPVGRVYTPDTTEIDKDMGAISAMLVKMPGRVRGNHPIGSFAAIGPLAKKLICSQASYNIYAPLWELAQLGGKVVLMGVGLDSMTLLHLVEQLAGRRPFVRWANGVNGKPVPVQDGGCSAGFECFEPALTHLITETHVGKSRWKILPALPALEAAVNALMQNPEMTRCAEPGCARCIDAIEHGGPDYTIPIMQGAFPNTVPNIRLEETETVTAMEND